MPLFKPRQRHNFETIVKIFDFRLTFIWFSNKILSDDITLLGVQFLPKAEYRSSIRSKNLIKKSLAKLLHEKEIGKITVSDIIRDADISRGTFYAHYTDINAVMEQIISEELEKFNSLLSGLDVDPDTSEIDRIIKAACEYMSADIDYYRMLSQSNLLDNFVARIINLYYDKLFESIHTKHPQYSRNEIDIYLLYITSGVKTVLLGWLSGDIDGSPAEISEKLSKLIALSRDYLSLNR